MKNENKIFIKYFLINGLVFAGIKVFFDDYDGESFSFLKFLSNFFFFGLFMGLLARFNYKKQLKIERIESKDK